VNLFSQITPELERDWAAVGILTAQQRTATGAPAVGIAASTTWATAIVGAVANKVIDVLALHLIPVAGGFTGQLRSGLAGAFISREYPVVNNLGPTGYLLLDPLPNLIPRCSTAVGAGLFLHNASLAVAIFDIWVLYKAR